MNLQEKITESTKKIFQAAKIADQDQTRPAYHFHSPGQWMDDPNGVIYYKGYYHMMYSLNPDTDRHRAGMVYKTGSSLWKTSEPDWTGGITVWGHARSRDLIHWEHMPVALYPDTDHGEYYIWFGCTAINDEGVPVAIYTSIGYEDRNPTDSAVQFIAFGEDDDLVRWRPGTEVNPIMTEALHQGKKIWEWRDPFLFRQNGKTYLLLGGKEDQEQGGKAAVLLYEAEDKAFAKWNYKGVLFRYPNQKLRSCECPNIVQLGEKWVIFVSPHGPVEYFVGDLDAENCSFTWEKHGFVDCSAHFYATNVITDDRGRKLLWGAVEGFQNTFGWNGINSLPREISLDENGRLVQRIPEELHELRGRTNVLDSDHRSAKAASAALELIVNFRAGEHGVLRLGDAEIEICADLLVAEDTNIRLEDRPEHTLHIFLDRSMMEIFIDEKDCFTAMVPPMTGECEVAVSGGDIQVQFWELNVNDLFSAYEPD